jgi:hypothetical protein
MRVKIREGVRCAVNFHVKKSCAQILLPKLNIWCSKLGTSSKVLSLQFANTFREHEKCWTLRSEHTRYNMMLHYTCGSRCKFKEFLLKNITQVRKHLRYQHFCWQRSDTSEYLSEYVEWVILNITGWLNGFVCKWWQMVKQGVPVNIREIFNMPRYVSWCYVATIIFTDHLHIVASKFPFPLSIFTKEFFIIKLTILLFTHSNMIALISGFDTCFTTLGKTTRISSMLCTEGHSR